MPIIYRTTGAWGPGKGSQLTGAEVDGNFYEVLTRIVALETDPNGPVEIDYFVVTGSQLYVYMTNHAVLGPYQLPVAAWTWRGEWAPATGYNAMDVITSGGSTYLVRLDHTSDASFDPGANDGEGHEYYGLMLGSPDPNADIAFYYRGRIRAAGGTLFEHVAVRQMILPQNLTGSVAYLTVAPTTEDISLSIYRNSFLLGSIEFSCSMTPDIDGGMAGTFVFAAQSYLQPGERLSIREPIGTEDYTALGLSVTIKATLP